MAYTNNKNKCTICSKVFHDKYQLKTHIGVHNTDQPYSCNLCDYRCKVKKYLSRHKKKVHTKANGPSCNVCGKVFHFSSSLKNHMRVHTGERPYHCEVCNKSFSSTYCLSMHRLIHTNEKPFECKFCDYACRDSSTLRRHEERHMGTTKMYPCNRCKKTFNTNAKLKMHVNEIHFGLDMKQIPCEHCGKLFKTNSTKNTHVKAVHQRAGRSKCEICDRIVSNKNNMLSHLKSHIDIRPFKCSFKNCDKYFKDRGTLRRHTLIHYPELYYQCDLCDSRFVRKTRLRDHKKWHVTNGFICYYCGGSFKTKTYLQTHITRKHMKPGERYICDMCQSVHYTKQSIILHLRYGHGHRDERKCRICGVVLQNNPCLSEHYLNIHKVRYTITEKEGDVTIKKEPEELSSQNFVFDYEVQKTEIDDGVEPLDNSTGCNKMEEVNIIPNIENIRNPQDDFKDYIPEYADTETTLAYSEQVLEEDLSRSITESKMNKPDSPFDEFFNEIVDKSQRKKLGKEIVDESKLLDIQKTIDKMLRESRMQKNMVVLEEMRLEYNNRILLANKSKSKKVPTKIKYFKKTETELDNLNGDTNSSDDNISAEENDDKDSNIELFTDKELVNEFTNELVTRSTNEIATEATKELVIEPANEEVRTGFTNKLVNKSTNEIPTVFTNEIAIGSTNEISTGFTNEVAIGSTNEISTGFTNKMANNKELVTDSTNELVNDSTNELVNDSTNELVTRPKRKANKVKKYDESINNEINKNGKITFVGHECYVCFKVFKTKEELKFHCKEHFDICNEKMLKKCPFCGYVTNLNIKRHIEIVHKININYDSAHISEKPNSTGSKYVFRIDKDCELEIIPSISNLNKIAGMKVDAKNRKNNNLFIGKTKLVRKNNEWVVEKQAMGINSDNILPVFTDNDYKKLKLTGDSYFDRLQQLGFLAKLKGSKMLYPCQFCDKICRALAALKLHNRKHEENPKQYKPKVWVNRHIEYTTKNRKKRNNKPKEIPQLPVVVKKKPKYSAENRHAAPQPVKNNHKCDKKLIEFYRNNIKGKDIEFWQFLKIYNKINRENVNDFDDLVNREDGHFGMHTKVESIASNSNGNMNKKPVSNGKKSTKKSKQNKSVTKIHKADKKKDKPVIEQDKPKSNRNKPVSNPNLSQNQTRQSKDDSSIFNNKPVNTEKPVSIGKPVTIENPVIPKKMYQIKKNISIKRNRVFLISKSENLRRNAIKNEMRQRLAK